MSLTQPNQVQAVGVDVSKLQLDIDTGGRRWRVPNGPLGIRRLLAHLPADAHLFVEATGGYERALCRAAHRAGIPISVLNPLRVRQFARSRGLLAKTDRLDARVLRAYGESTPCRVSTPKPAALEELATLNALRDELVKIQTQLHNAAEHLTLRTARAAWGKVAAALTKQIARLEKEAAQRVQQTPALALRQAALTAHYGIGETIAHTLLVGLPELGTLNRQRIAALAGLAPHPDDSGQRRGQRHIRGGRPKVRRALYLAALTAIRQEQSFLRDFYCKLRARKPAKVALIAAARRLLVYLNAQFHNLAFPPLIPSPQHG